jgi:D-alanine-D-alanine ligase
MKKPRALVLVHATLVPPDSLRDSPRRKSTSGAPNTTSFRSCKAAGHEVMPLGLSDSLSELRRAIVDWKPQIVFNLLEEFDGIVTYDQHVVAFLELMRQPYTGCNPRGMLLSRDKVLSKQLLTYHRVPTPQFMVFARGKKSRIPKRLRFPMFVKSSTEDASLGIAHASVVCGRAQLKERIAFIHEQTHSDALVEEYIEGRELYVGVIGNDRLKVLPVWEMTFGSCRRICPPSPRAR